MAEFVPPGPGFWQLDRSHFTGGTTPLMRWLLCDSVESAYFKQWPLLGIPAETLSVAFVEGFMYTRLRPLVRPDHPSSKPPPTWLLKAICRVHPEFRRRARAAEKMLTQSPSPAVIAEWHGRIRPALVEKNLAFQDADLATLSQDELSIHLENLLTHLRWTFEEHFRLHGYDLGPIGQLLLAGQDWGLNRVDLLAALAGASPSTLVPWQSLLRIKESLDKTGAQPSSLAEVAQASPETAKELQDYLRFRGAVLFAGYDLDSPTLGESPGVILASILNVSKNLPSATAVGEAAEASLRAQLATPNHAEFDRLLSAAREAMDLRDDNGPITAEWPCGLLRLTILEFGRRLVIAGLLHEATHIFELDRSELLAAAAHQSPLRADQVAQRAAHRAQQKTLLPPATLGSPETPPPLDALPKSLATAVSLVQTVISAMGMGDHQENTEPGPSLTGTGIGNKTVTGVARVAESAEEAFDRLLPGEILVTRTTSPAYNMVLTLVGGLVTTEGGPMSHAAVLSRELSISAVIGAADALTSINDGDIIEINPATGEVTVTG